MTTENALRGWIFSRRQMWRERPQMIYYRRGLIRIFTVVTFLSWLQTVAPETGRAQTGNGSDPKYNSPIAAMNHLVLGLDLIKAGTPDDLYYARQNFQFIINMKDDRGLKPIAYLNLGVVDTLEDKPEAAIKNFLSAIELNPNYSEA